MAKESWPEASLILVDTPDNGDRDLLLPSINFNHCIAQLDAGNKRTSWSLLLKNYPSAH